MNPKAHGLCSSGRSEEVPLTTMAVLGTGGHTTEMALLLQHVSRAHYRPLVYVYTHPFCRETVEKLEESHKNVENCQFLWIARSRAVGQSWFSSAISTALAVPRAVLHVLWHQPALLLCNGPGVCMPVCLGAVLLNVLWGRRCAIVFVESLCRVKKLSLTGKLLRYVATVFCVQWPVPGSPPWALCLAEESKDDNRPCASSASLPTAAGGSRHGLVTVGSTNFDGLISVLDANAAEFADSLRSLGIDSVTVQIGGTSEFSPKALEALPGFRVVRTMPRSDFLEEVERAELIIGHAGAGTILDALSRGKRLLIVPNRTLMDDHQLELCEALEGRHCLSCSEHEVIGALRGGADRFREIDCALPPHLTTSTFAKHLDSMLRT